ncbi:MAG: hypothetical protein V3V99_13770 [candidate division Zixibacteria bacterium]
MGHLRLGDIYKTRRWKKVIELLKAGGDISTIAEASMLAAQSGLGRIPNDAGFTHTLTTIFKFLESAGSKDFISNLNGQGYSLSNDASLFDIVSALKSRIDYDLNSLHIKSDASEIAQNAFTEALIKNVSTETGSLFETTSESMQKSISKYATGKRLAELMHNFLSSFTSRYLSYHLDRELPSHIGQGLRFQDINDHDKFNEAFNTYIRETVRISKEFTPGWFGKAKFNQDLSSESVAKFAHVAFKKISNEFARGGE